MDAVLAAVLALHVYFVSVSAAGPLGVWWCDWWGRPDDEAVQRGATWMAWMSLVALFIGAILGLLVGVVVWDEDFRNALSRLHGKLAWGTLEWLFSLILTALVAWWWKKRPDASGWPRRIRGLLSLLSATNLLYHFSFLFFVMQKVADEGGEGPIDAARFREYMADGLILAQAIHFLLATWILAGVTWMALAASRLRRDPEDKAARRIATWGLWMMHLLAMAALGRATPGKLRLAIVVTMVVLVSMLFVARKTQARKMAVHPAGGSSSGAWVDSEPGIRRA